VKLEFVLHRFLKEGARVRLAFLASLVPDQGRECEASHPLGREMAVVRLHDAWVRFCRELVLESAAGGAVTLSGVKLRRVAKTKSEALNRVRALHPRRYEPRWGDPTLCLRAAGTLGLRNYSQVSAGVGLTPSPIEDLQLVRNHLVHRHVGGREVDEIRDDLGLPIGARAIDLVEAPVPPGIPLLIRWSDQLQIMARLACT
jgi:hypothetical protein